MTLTNLVILVSAFVLTAVYSAITGRAAPVIAGFFARLHHVHTPTCGHR